jgi:hypothetical protein
MQCSSRTLNLPIPDAVEGLVFSFLKPYEFYRFLTEKFLWDELGTCLGNSPIRILAGFTEELLLDGVTSQEKDFWKFRSHKTGGGRMLENLMNMGMANATRYFLATHPEVFTLPELERACVFAMNNKSPTFSQRQIVRLVLDSTPPEVLREYYFTQKEASINTTMHYFGGYFRLLLLKNKFVSYDKERCVIFPGRIEVSDHSPVDFLVASEAPCTDEFRELLKIQPDIFPHIVEKMYYSPIITHMENLSKEGNAEEEAEKRITLDKTLLESFIVTVRSLFGL